MAANVAAGGGHSGPGGHDLLIAHRISLDPTNVQRTCFAQAAGVARFSWNWALAEWRRQYAAHRADPSLPQPEETVRRALDSPRGPRHRRRPRRPASKIARSSTGYCSTVRQPPEASPPSPVPAGSSMSGRRLASTASFSRPAGAGCAPCSRTRRRGWSPSTPRHTSQTCAACGEIHATSRQSQANFHCVACGHADHADLNAARRSGVGDWRCCTARGVRTQRPRRPVKWIGDWRRESSTYRYEPQTNSTRTSLHVVRQETSVPDTGARYQPRGVDQCPC